MNSRRVTERKGVGFGVLERDVITAGPLWMQEGWNLIDLTSRPEVFGAPRS